MALTVTDLIQGIRDRLSDTESTPMFSDTELKRLIALAVKDFSRYVATSKTTTITILASPATNYALPDDCLIVLEARDPGNDNALFEDWEQVGNDLVVAEDLIDSVSSLTVKYGAIHARTGSSPNETYSTIQSVHENEVLDLAQARCLRIMATEWAKRPTYGDTQVKVDHGGAALTWQRQAAALEERVHQHLTSVGGGLS